MTTAREIEIRAAEWIARSEEPDWSPSDQRHLEDWLSESDAHKAAYWRLESGWRAADRIGALGIGQAPPRRTFNPKQFWGRVGAAACVAALFAGTPLLMTARQSGKAATTLFQTPLGGHNRVALPDGSTVELNTSTVIRAGLSKASRDVWLDRGEAFFSIKHLQVPFVVHAGPRVITVLGTKFSVSREGDLVRVAVVQGTVRVSDANDVSPNPEATITRGDLLETANSSTLVLQNAEDRIEQSLAWRGGMLEFEQTPLAEAADQFNRYNQRKLLIRGSAATLPIGGSFRTSNVEAFARLLHDAYGLHVDYTPTEIKISS